MFTLPNGKITASQLLFPVSLLAFVIFIMLAFQVTQLVHDRSMLHQVYNNQTKAIEEAQRVQAQLNALAMGTQKLSLKGDKNAEAIISRMKQMGITVNMPPGTAPAAAPDAAPVGSAPAVPAAPAK